MHVLGVATVKRATADGLDLDAASLLGMRRSYGAGLRHVLNAERDIVKLNSGRWRRVGVGPADCDFCDMLISRGAVYRSDRDAGEADTWHDRCDCLVEPDVDHTRGVRGEDDARYGRDQ